jgi:hypothetical protein
MLPARAKPRQMSDAGDPVAAGAFARARFDTFDSHQRKESDIVLPLLMDANALSLTVVMASAHDHAHHRRGPGDDHAD